MKQLLFMTLATVIGTFGVFFVSPFLGVAIYYLFAVLRPQALWQWSLPPGIAWSQYVAIATLLGAVLQGVGFLQPSEEEKRPRWTIGHWLTLGFAIWIGLSYLTAVSRYTAYPWLVEYSKIFLMLALGAFLIRTVKQLWILFCMTAIVLGYIAYEMNFLYLISGYLSIYRRGYGGLDNNGAGLMIAMGLPLCVFAWEGSERRWRWLLLVFAPLIIHAVLMSYSRGAMLSLLCSVPLMLFRSRKRLMFTAVTLALAAMVPTLAGQEIRARFFTLQEYDVDASANSRFGSWEAAFRMAQDRPILGFGLRNSQLFSLEYGADIQGRVIHSQYLQLAADTGFVGLGFFLGTLGMMWWGTVRTRRKLRKRTDRDARRLIAIMNGVECSLLIFCVGALFLSLEVFELPYLLVLLGLQSVAVARITVLAEAPAPTAEPRRTAPSGWEARRPSPRPSAAV